MAASSNKRTPSSKKNVGKKNTTRKTSMRNNREKVYQTQRDSELFREIGLLVLSIAMIFLFLCNFGVVGSVGDFISGVLFGLFGFLAYITPIVIFLGVSFWFANEGCPTAFRKLISGVVLFLMIGVLCDLFVQNASSMDEYSIQQIYEKCRDGKMGGGVFSGSIHYFMHHYLETIGTVLIVILLISVCVILLTEKTFLGEICEKGSALREQSRISTERRRELNEIKRLEHERIRTEKEKIRAEKEEERRLRIEEKENERILRMEKKVAGVTLNTSLEKTAEESHSDDVHEITLDEDFTQVESVISNENMGMNFEHIQINSVHQVTAEEVLQDVEEIPSSIPEMQMDQIRVHKEGVSDNGIITPKAKVTSQEEKSTPKNEHFDLKMSQQIIRKKYCFPPIDLLKKGKSSGGDSAKELKETAIRLQQTLHTFGVNVTITDISQGPSVTRYELQPEQGVKVSKIVGLSDDIKLNLAATDIRIEAPIPGKAAVGIEVPNKENMMVALRDLLENKEFINFPSNIAFAVGKDIGGKVVVADIKKMPHVLIAGATGSGKSVCINTLIMSILYKANPDDVKLIMIDPKVVELSVYNGIPHLLIPVVTDPKKASAALHWGVSEMEERYQKFAEFNVRDLAGYNKKIEGMKQQGDESAPKKMPQIVIIVDELADLMMVCPGEVEESICRLAQLARAAGIHLVIATQRPSVDVITGLIKANMPSRIAFAVSSGVDSRTILDKVGAEKLLGKGDMLFAPQGYPRPARIQGAFVSDKEVSDVVDFLKNQSLGNVYATEVEERIKTMGTNVIGTNSDGNLERDEYFEDAGRFIIEKEKASIGMLQRVLKIGFNRAARIMDQLCEYGVVGEEEGTKPRKVLMSIEQFEQLLEEI